MNRRSSRPGIARLPRWTATVLAGAWLLAGCSVFSVATPAPSTAVRPNAAPTLSPEAAAIPKLLVEFDGRELLLAGYDPLWPESMAADREAILRLAPHLSVERGRTYPVTMRYQATDPVTGWLPPDFRYVGGSEPVRTADGFVTDRPTSAFVRDDALPDFEAGLFGVKVQTPAGERTFAYPVWIEEPDVLPADAFAGLRLGISDEDVSAASSTFIDHVRTDLGRGGGPPPVMFDTRADLLAAFEAGEINAYVAIPSGWAAHPTTRNGFEQGSTDAVTGNAATDTGASYLLSSLVVRALGPAGLVIDRGY